MSAYRTVVVGTDGSESSLRAVAPAVARVGAGAGEVRTVAVAGSPVEALLDVVRREHADLRVGGNRGLNSVTGRLLGSVPAGATRRSACDVLVVHTTG